MFIDHISYNNLLNISLEHGVSVPDMIAELFKDFVAKSVVGIQIVGDQKQANIWANKGSKSVSKLPGFTNYYTIAIRIV